MLRSQGTAIVIAAIVGAFLLLTFETWIHRTGSYSQVPSKPWSTAGHLSENTHAPRPAIVEALLQALPLPQQQEPGYSYHARPPSLQGQETEVSEPSARVGVPTSDHQRQHQHQHDEQHDEQQPQHLAPQHAHDSAASSLAAQSRPHGSHSRLVLLPDLHGDADQAAAALTMAGVLDLAAQRDQEQQLKQQQRQDRGSGDSSLGSPNGTSAAGARGSGGDGAGGGAAVSAPLEPWGWRWVWGGGDTLLVQLGDVVDRGPHSLALLVLLERLKAQARVHGGDVLALLGNHELMNVHHDFRYISRAELLALGEAGQLPPMDLGPGPREAGLVPQEGHPEHGREALPSTMRQANAEVQPPLQKQQGEARTVPLNPDAADTGRELLNQQQQQQQQQPLLQRGLAVWEQALSPHQALGRLVRSRPAAAIVEGGGCRVLVVHAGAFPWMVEKAEDLVRRVAGMATGASAAGASAEAGAGVRGGGGEGGQQEGDLGRGQGDHDGDGVQGRERGEWGLSGEEVVRLWNAAVWEQLRECEGWECGDRGHARQGEQQGEQQQHEHGAHVVGAGGGPASRTGNSSSGGKNSSTASNSGGSAREAAARVAALRGVLRRELRQLAGPLLGGDGAVWSRRYIKAGDQKVCSEVAQLVVRLGVQRVVVGHTVQQGGRVTSRCGGRLLMADVGLSRAIAGHAAALVCSDGGDLRAVYAGGKQQPLPLQEA